MRVFPSNNRKQAGFTIPELLVTIFIISLLALGAFFLLRTHDEAAARNDALRRTDLALLVQVLNEYHYENKQLPDNMPTTATPIGSEDGQFDLCTLLVPDYLTDLPFDPQVGLVSVDGACDAEDQQYITGYTIMKSKDGKTITLASPMAQGAAISITKQY